MDDARDTLVENSSEIEAKSVFNNDISKSIDSFELEVEQLQKSIQYLKSDDEEIPIINDRIAQLQGRLAEMKVRDFLASI